MSLEWAKDSSVRTITTADLRCRNEVMATARQSDDGSGQQIIDGLGRSEEWPRTSADAPPIVVIR